MTTFFISDLHLEASRPEISEIFFRFIATQARQAQALYILGDLFEAWVGDDDDNDLHCRVIKALRQLVDHKVPVYFMAGNRDFLIGTRFLKASGCQLLKDPSLITLYNRQLVLTHGDLLCTNDTKYLKFRKWARSRLIQHLFLQLPLWLRQAIANRIRAASQHHTKLMPNHIMDVTPGQEHQLLHKYQGEMIIHGHTHRPAIYDLGNNKTRIVLAAWHKQGNALVYDNNNYQLVYFV